MRFTLETPQKAVSASGIIVKSHDTDSLAYEGYGLRLVVESGFDGDILTLYRSSLTNLPSVRRDEIMAEVLDGPRALNGGRADWRA